MIYELISRAQSFIRNYRQESRSPEIRRVLWHVTQVHIFIFASGQSYRYWDYHASLGAGRPDAGSPPVGNQCGASAHEARELLVQLLERYQSHDERKYVLANIDALDFIAATNQCGEFEDFIRQNYGRPAYVVAHFDTREAAEAWLRNHPEPPSNGTILVGDESYQVHYFREENRRVLGREYVLEEYIESALERGLPPAEASFNTRAEADEWLASHPNPSRATFVMIAGEYHLAAYFKNIDHRVICPISIVERWKEHKRRVAEMRGTEGEDDVEEEESQDSP